MRAYDMVAVSQISLNVSKPFQSSIDSDTILGLV